MGLSIRIDRSACQGEKQCVKRAPRTFRLDREGKAEASESPGDNEEAIREAANACPHFAVTVASKSD